MVNEPVANLPDPALLSYIHDWTVRCIHHWMIKAPVGEISVGTCKLCGASREFSNTSLNHYRPVPRGREQRRPAPDGKA